MQFALHYGQNPTRDRVLPNSPSVPPDPPRENHMLTTFAGNCFAIPSVSASAIIIA
jgi:hypothetical protein